MPKTKSTAPTTSAAASVTTSKKKVEKTTPAAKVEKIAAAKVVETIIETVIDTAADTDPADTIVAELAKATSAHLEKLAALSQGIGSLRAEFRVLEKAWTKHLKAATKAGAKKKRKAGTRQPSGFVKPTLISAELALFLGKETGTEMARTEVTREINKYIRANNLQDSTNGRRINADDALLKLLRLKKDDELTYFNLQRYMSPHFAKAGQPLPAAEPAFTGN